MFKIGDKIKLKPYEEQIRVSESISNTARAHERFEEKDYNKIFTIKAIDGTSGNKFLFLYVFPDLHGIRGLLDKRFVLAYPNLFETEE